MTPNATKVAIKTAIHYVGKELRETKRNVMADPRAEELRAEKLNELEGALMWLYTQKDLV